MSTFDIARAKDVSAREEEGQTFIVKDEQQNEMDGVTITVAGSYSKRFKAASDALRKWNKKNPNPSEEMASKKATELFASCVIAWTGFVEGGAPIPCTIENIVAVMDAAPWVANQIVAAVHDHSAFFETASAS